MSDPFLFLGPEFAVNATTSGLQTDASLHGLVGGGFVSVWTYQSGPGSQVYGQMFDGSGTPVGAELILVDHGTSYANRADVVGLDTGGFVVTYTSNHGAGGLGVYSQRYDASGAAIGPEVLINTATGDTHYDSHVDVLQDGSLIYTYTGLDRDGSGAGVFAQRMSVEGGKLGPEVVVNQTTSGDQSLPEVTYLSNGGYAVAYAAKGLDGNNFGIAARLFMADGTAITAELQINQTAVGAQTMPDITVLSDGSLVVTWQSKGQDGDGYGVYARVLDASGGFLTDEILVNTITHGQQTAPTVQGLPDGGYYILWTDQSQDIFGQRFSADHSANGGQTQISTGGLGGQQNPEIALLGNGDLVAGYGTTNDGSSSGVLAQLIEGAYFGTDGDDVLQDITATGRMFGAKGADRLTGLSGRDLIKGQKGEDVLKGGKGADTLLGGSGDDRLYGGNGNDILIGAAGQDDLIGGRGRDTLTGGGATDTFVFSTGHGRDVITDFAASEDILRLDSSLWAGDLTATDVINTFGTVANGAARLTFDGGERIIFEDIDDVAFLTASVEIY